MASPTCGITVADCYKVGSSRLYIWTTVRAPEQATTRNTSYHHRSTDFLALRVQVMMIMDAIMASILGSIATVLVDSHITTYYTVCGVWLSRRR